MNHPVSSRGIVISLGVLAGATLLAPCAAGAASLTAFSGIVAGPGNGNIAAGCTTSGPPSDLAFFSGYGAGLQVLGAYPRRTSAARR